MIAMVLIAATVSAAEPAPTVQPAPPAEKKMGCCDKAAKGEDCDCCKGKEGKSSADSHGEQGHEH